MPKTVRERYGLHPQTAVEFVEHPDGILIRPAPSSQLVEENGFLLLTGKLTEPVDDDGPIRKLRRERTRKLFGIDT